MGNWEQVNHIKAIKIITREGIVDKGRSNRLRVKVSSLKKRERMIHTTISGIKESNKVSVGYLFMLFAYSGKDTIYLFYPNHNLF